MFLFLKIFHDSDSIDDFKVYCQDHTFLYTFLIFNGGITPLKEFFKYFILNKRRKHRPSFISFIPLCYNFDVAESQCSFRGKDVYLGQSLFVKRAYCYPS